MSGDLTGPRDAAVALRRYSGARVGLGRRGAGLPTTAMLDFQADHARARDAVHAVLDTDRIQRELEAHPTLVVASRARDRAAYLRNPGLGRRLRDEDAMRLSPGPPGPYDIAFVIADGLSATAVNAHAAALLEATLPALADLRIAPVVIARQARVALGDDIGERLGAGLVAILIGERPGLSASDSLGVYLTLAPRVGRLDSERNCISNIRPGGQSYGEAAGRLVWLIRAARRLGLTGVGLKDGFTPPGGLVTGGADPLVA